MKVLVLLTARETGGAELAAERLITALGEQCAFTVALADDTGMDGLASRLARHVRVLRYPFDRPVALPLIMRELRRLADRQDLVHLNSNHPGSRLGILAAFGLAGGASPLICVEHSATPMRSILVPRSIVWVLPTLFRLSRRNVARIVTVSEASAIALQDLYGIVRERVTVVHNGVDLRRFGESGHSSLRAELGLDPDRPIVLTLARYLPSKGYRFLIDAIPAIRAVCPQVQFVFAGSPDGRAALEQQIAALGVQGNVALLGFRDDTVNLLRGSDLFVLPSLAEGFSLAIIEALAAGLPVVATRVGGAAEAITDGSNGLLVPPADSAALARAITRILAQSPQERAAMRAAAYTSAQRFSLDAMASAMLEVYRAAVRA